MAAWDAERWAVEIAGWSGAGLILFAYLLLSMGRLHGRSPAYQAMNLAGSAGFIVNGLWHGAIPSAALNILWLFIAAFALTRILRARDASTAPTRAATPEGQ